MRAVEYTLVDFRYHCGIDSTFVFDSDRGTGCPEGWLRHCRCQSFGVPYQSFPEKGEGTKGKERKEKEDCQGRVKEKDFPKTNI